MRELHQKPVFDGDGDGLPSELTITKSPERSPRFDYVDWRCFCLTTCLAFAGYWFTLAPDLTLEYSGLMSTGAKYAGVPHVPGYPVWTLYSWLFTRLLPFSNIAWRVAVGSAVASATACGLVALMISRCGSMMFPESAGRGQPTSRLTRLVCAVVAGLVLAFTNVVWRSAVVADFWALSLLLFAGVLTAFLLWLSEPARRGFLVMAFFLFGLLLTSSQELITALPCLVIAVMFEDEKLGRDLALFLLPLVALVTSANQHSVWIEYPTTPNTPLLLIFILVISVGLGISAKTRGLGTEWRATLLCLGALLCGLALYFYVPLASMTNPPVNWGYARTMEGFFHVLGRGQFERLNPTSDPGRLVRQLLQAIGSVGCELGWLYLLLASLPVCFIGRSRSLRIWIMSLVVVWIGVGPLLLAELNPPIDRQAQELIACYFGAAYTVVAVLLGVGLILCCTLLTNTLRGEKHSHSPCTFARSHLPSRKTSSHQDLPP